MSFYTKLAGSLSRARKAFIFYLMPQCGNTTLLVYLVQCRILLADQLNYFHFCVLLIAVLE